MQLRFVEIFCEVVQTLSFSKAAKMLGISQPAVSQAVASIEERLGVALFDRTHRPIALTSEGELYYSGCRDLLDNFRSLETRLQNLKNAVVGEVRVAGIYSVGHTLMKRYQKRFAELYPGASVHYDLYSPDEVYSAIQNEECDIGIVSFPRDSKEFTSLPWQQQPLGLVVYPEHRLADEKQVSVANLSGEDFVGFTSDLEFSRQMQRWLKDARVQVKIVQRLATIQNIKEAIEEGLGVGVLPMASVTREVERKSLFLIPFSDVHWFRPLGIVHKSSRLLPVAVHKLIELLQDDPDKVFSRLDPRLASHLGATGGPSLPVEETISLPIRAQENTTDSLLERPENESSLPHRFAVGTSATG